ncbi:hypothetical protein K435DRAFT_49910 [Dendrothele bispora CBS 962.96]|uniref:Uncharacterized protein n=1 Tax=Dendrothele bispora (strain CBS 962.96) TaxID=1314807 RepID=A0A4S8M722_DENBC|nr:hypothetical protein K435DRAFT_49910 [Dendrothele bispora CBS 962.96]
MYAASKETFRGYLKKEKDQMFNVLVSRLEGNLTRLANDAGGMLEYNLLSLARKIDASLRVLWEVPGTQSPSFNDSEKKDLIRIMEQVLACIRLQKEKFEARNVD